MSRSISIIIGNINLFKVIRWNDSGTMYWTTAWLNYLGSPTDMAAYATVDNRLRSLFKYLMDLPEYQLS